MWCGVVWCGVVRCGVVCGAVWCGVVWSACVLPVVECWVRARAAGRSDVMWCPYVLPQTPAALRILIGQDLVLFGVERRQGELAGGEAARVEFLHLRSRRHGRDAAGRARRAALAVGLDGAAPGRGGRGAAHRLDAGAVHRAVHRRSPPTRRVVSPSVGPVPCPRAGAGMLFSAPRERRVSVAAARLSVAACVDATLAWTRGAAARGCRRARRAVAAAAVWSSRGAPRWLVQRRCCAHLLARCLGPRTGRAQDFTSPCNL